MSKIKNDDVSLRRFISLVLSVTAPFICHPEVNVSCHAGNRSVKVQTLYFVKMTTLFVRAECS
jgi:hypothetical protein